MINEYEDDVDEFSEQEEDQQNTMHKSDDLQTNRSHSVYSSFGIMRPGFNRLNQRFTPIKGNLVVPSSALFLNTTNSRTAQTSMGLQRNDPKFPHHSQAVSGLPGSVIVTTERESQSFLDGKLTYNRTLTYHREEVKSDQRQIEVDEFRLHQQHRQDDNVWTSSQPVTMDKHVEEAQRYVLNLRTSEPGNAMNLRQSKQQNPIVSPESQIVLHGVESLNIQHPEQDGADSKNLDLLTSFFTTTSGKNYFNFQTHF